jgi:hypothetical protein
MGRIMKVKIGSLDRHGPRIIRQDFAHRGALKLPVTEEVVSIDGRSYSVASRVLVSAQRGQLGGREHDTPVWIKRRSMKLLAALVVVAGLVGLLGCNAAAPARNANWYAGNQALFGHFDLGAAELRSNLAALEAENADPYDITQTEIYLANICRRTGEVAEAIRLADEAEDDYRSALETLAVSRPGPSPEEADALEGLASLLDQTGRGAAELQQSRDRAAAVRSSVGSCRP